MNRRRQHRHHPRTRLCRLTCPHCNRRHERGAPGARGCQSFLLWSDRPGAQAPKPAGGTPASFFRLLAVSGTRRTCWQAGAHHFTPVNMRLRGKAEIATILPCVTEPFSSLPCSGTRDGIHREPRPGRPRRVRVGRDLKGIGDAVWCQTVASRACLPLYRGTQQQSRSEARHVTPCSTPRQVVFSSLPYAKTRSKPLFYLPSAVWSMVFSWGPSSGDCPWQPTNFVASQLSTREEKAALFWRFVAFRREGGREGVGGRKVCRGIMLLSNFTP